MSKSKPDSAIFMTDSEEDVTRKIHNGYCPAKQTEENPILEYCKYILFEKQKELKIERPAKFGGPMTFASYEELATAFRNGELHPLDIKKAVAAGINKLLNPVRIHFTKDAKAKQLLEQVQSFQVTR